MILLKLGVRQHQTNSRVVPQVIFRNVQRKCAVGEDGGKQPVLIHGNTPPPPSTQTYAFVQPPSPPNAYVLNGWSHMTFGLLNKI